MHGILMTLYVSYVLQWRKYINKYAGCFANTQIQIETKFKKMKENASTTDL